MGRTVALLTIIMSLAVQAGYAGESVKKTVNIAGNQRVFEEVAENAAPEPGYAYLSVYCSLKTHKPGAHAAKDSHGAPDFVLALEIDGQRVVLRAITREEKTGCMSPTEPEEGDGIRYEFTKRLRMKAGTHRVIIAVPSDSLAMEREITLSGNQVNRLTLKPVYGRSPNRQRGYANNTSFKEGIKGFQVILNGNSL